MVGTRITRMTNMSKQSGFYILRFFVVLIAFLGLPFFPFLFLGFIPENFRWLFLLWVPVGFFLWARLSRRLLVTSRYTCPKCARKIARIEVVEDGDKGHVFIACPNCGFREKSDSIAWHAPSG
jgi:DNA-directed RNA polymerase subunit RPC12/RpoP